jgi:tetratricopeptide (TPR) repeat protein
MMSDVARLEHGILGILESVFSDPHVPPEVMALKEQTYGRIRLWLSCRYYAAAQWDDAQRNLCEALALRPDLLADPCALAELFAKDARSARVADPLEFAGNVLEHLPACAQGVQGYRAPFLGQIYFMLAMRAYRTNDIDCARKQLSQAIALAPFKFEQVESFARGLCYCAVHLPVSSPTHYVDVVLQNLPVKARHMSCVRERVLGELNVKLAYQDYVSGRWGPAIHRILMALRHRPSLIGNRRAISILVRSLLGPTAKGRCSS